MAIDRRRRALLVAAAAAAGGAAVSAPVLALPGGPPRASPADTWPALLGAWEHERAHYVGRWTDAGGARGVAVRWRAHQVVADPRNRGAAVAVARRPGDYVLRFDADAARITVIEATDPERLFNGHAAFSADARTLYTTENDVDDGAGVIGVRDAATLVKAAEFPTGGIGPHALLVEPGGTLLVANGGVLTLPETGRAKRNLERMDASLARVDPADGRCIGQWRLGDPHLGLRHLARAPDGTVGIALQAEHADAAQRERAPVLALFDGATLRSVELPAGIALGGYGGDIACIARDGHTRYAVSCPRAGVVAWWDARGRWLGATSLPAACGLVARGELLVAASEDGGLARVAPGAGRAVDVRNVGLRWDNHLDLCG